MPKSIKRPAKAKAARKGDGGVPTDARAWKKMSDAEKLKAIHVERRQTAERDSRIFRAIPEGLFNSLRRVIFADLMARYGDNEMADAGDTIRPSFDFDDLRTLRISVRLTALDAFEIEECNEAENRLEAAAEGGQ